MATRFSEKYGPYALVAGGSYGLGAAFAEAIAKRGLNLVILARQDDQLRSTADRLIEEYGVDVLAIAADLADFEGVKERIANLKVSIGLLATTPPTHPLAVSTT